MDFLKSYAEAGSFEMTSNHLSDIFNAMTKDNKLVKDHVGFYSWLKTITDEVFRYGKRLIDKKDLYAFFKEKMASESADFRNLSREGFFWIQTFFVKINKKAGRLIVYDDETKPALKQGGLKTDNKDDKGGKKSVSFAEGGTQTSADTKPAFTSYSSETGAGYQSFSFTDAKVDENYMDKAVGSSNEVYYGPWAPGKGPNQGAPSTPTNKKETTVKEEVDLIVRVPPQEMEGINILWKIAFDCEGVGKEVMRLLRQLHTEVDFGPDGKE